MPRNICITAVDGHTGHLIAELLVSNPDFKKNLDSVCGLSLHPHSAVCKELEKLGVKIVPHKPGRVREMVKTLEQTGADTMCLIPPPHKEKYDITVELIEATKKANVPNVCLISAAGCDLAERDQQPRLREFIDLECLFMASKGDPKSSAGHSPVVIRAGFYAENLLLYAPQAQEEGHLPLPIGKNHKFAPMALGDLSQVAAHVLTGKGKHGFSDAHRGQLMVLTAEARRVLHAQSQSDESEIQYLLEYYSLVRQGKTNYISTTAFHDVTGGHPQEPPDFFKTYKQEFLPHHAAKKRKTENK
ncbi:conserved hypothetical protein [Uncinocarpus reesii 1704]|uniref:NmrA-like domain-containing protein n=1 Tax=Uncinocarpus reesii (strain UAMH 1704) TaxID=336963 RepID=C4JD75_UNCRE|nr:uncharacterized protein UREG_00280 [Uncinocarpus reesii 1704]EEP75434.1 conserved hypothetical protein [Uncinocarpus reesii 1704]